MNKYIISGLSGNIGSLIKNEFSNVTEYSKHLNIENQNIFIHLASKSTGSYKNILKSNITYLSEVIEFCNKNNIKKFVFFSAISINTSEDLYSTSKLLGEKILKESGLDVLIIRLPMVLTRDIKNGILNRIIQKLEKNEDITLYNGDRKFNNFISIYDIYSFIINYHFKKKYEIIGLASSKENTLSEFVELMKNKLNSKSKIICSKKRHDFFNVSIKRAKNKYNYNPSKNEKILSNWIKIRNKGK